MGMKLVLGTKSNNPCKTEAIACGFYPSPNRLSDIGILSLSGNPIKHSALFYIFFKLFNQENSLFWWELGMSNDLVQETHLPS